MAALAASPTRAARTPGRPHRRSSSGGPTTEPPHKKRKYITGGPGGGGRFIDSEGKEQIMPSTGPRALAPARPRASVARMQSENSVQLVAPEEGETPARARSAMQTRPRRERPERYAPQPTTPRPRYSSSAAAAAAASQASDGYKPREERSWEDFHPHLEIELALPIYTADEVDGRTNRKDPKLLQRANSMLTDSRPTTNGDSEMRDTERTPELQEIVVTPMKRKPGRPPRRPESMLSGLGSPPAPRILPLPTHNPKERLNLPKPSFRQYNHFLQYEENQQENKKNYVDRTMANVGYQESDRFELPPKVLVRLTEAGQIEDEAEVSLHLESDSPVEIMQSAPVVGKVEYDMDEQDVAWLEGINDQRKSEGVDAIKPAIFEITMTQIEKEYHALEKRIPKPQPRHAQLHRPRSSSQAAVNGDPNPPGDEPDSKCAICDDGDCENANAIIFCDGCDLAVHQECYGVPFIPEGQWFCRKCKEIGRGTPTCIFCPNVDGAFKQTNTLRWSHLLCALWIPEVTVANMTFMEPISDVDKVPKGRWKLHCYICNQRMGACIQCGNKNCYQAFHVTCARRGKLFLKMKSQHQQGLDTTALKAFCDKHVPPEWRRTHDTDTAVAEAKRWYRHAMKDRRWADSQTAALELGAPAPPDGGLAGEDDTIAVTKRRKNQPPKQYWRLPSGAPVVPAVVFGAVEASLTRFTVRKRKEFVERVCRYWTLKREARRGAALLKRLQLQLESFSSMEITRRNFAGMGAAGRPRLVRRIEFAELLQNDMAHLIELCKATRKQEELRLQEVEILKELVDTVYFPIPKLLLPILQKARKLDEKTALFRPGLDDLAAKLRERYFTSVADFSSQLSIVLSNPFAAPSSDEAEPTDLHTIATRLSQVKPGSDEHSTFSAEQKEAKKLAKRILKAVKEPLEDATRREAELRGKEVEAELRKLEEMSLFASANREDASVNGLVKDVNESAIEDEEAEAVAGASPPDVEMADADIAVTDRLAAVEDEETVRSSPRKKSTPASEAGGSRPSSRANSKRGLLTNGSTNGKAPLSPPQSTSPTAAPGALAASVAAAPSIEPADPADVFATGGVPWYLTPFDPIGTTVHEERYTGRAVLRDMSEELSDMDEDTLTELAGSGVGEALMAATPAQGGEGEGKGDEVAAGVVKKKVPKRKGRRNAWDRRRR